ncbi:MAG: PaaI family thioesterase [Pseudomonadota bacterium]
MKQPALFDETSAPPASKLLGWRLIELDPEALTIRVGFEAKPDFVNPMGVVQGGFQAAMLDDCFGPLVFIAGGGRRFGATTDLHMTYLRALRPGAVECAARVVRAGKAMIFLEGELFDASGRLCARATASFYLAPER